MDPLFEDVAKTVLRSLRNHRLWPNGAVRNEAARRVSQYISQLLQNVSNGSNGSLSQEAIDALVNVDLNETEVILQIERVRRAPVDTQASVGVLLSKFWSDELMAAMATIQAAALDRQNAEVSRWVDSLCSVFE